jgi:hypothetical protein
VQPSSWASVSPSPLLAAEPQHTQNRPSRGPAGLHCACLHVLVCVRYMESMREQLATCSSPDVLHHVLELAVRGFFLRHLRAHLRHVHRQLCLRAHMHTFRHAYTHAHHHRRRKTQVSL